MKRVYRFPVIAALACFTATPALAQTTTAATAPPAQSTSQQPPKPLPPQPNQAEQPQKYEETVVVSASRTEEKLINAPTDPRDSGSRR